MALAAQARDPPASPLRDRPRGRALGRLQLALLDLAFLLTDGGPAGTTTNWPLLLYNQNFVALDAGRAAVVGIAIFLAGVVALGFVLVFDGLRRRRYAT